MLFGSGQKQEGVVTKQTLIGCAVVIVLAALLVVIIAASVIVYRMPGPEPGRVTSASSAIDPADPDQLPPIEAGERVEALSTDGWQLAQVLTVDHTAAELDYDADTLPNERLDLRLVRRVAVPLTQTPVGARPIVKANQIPQPARGPIGQVKRASSPEATVPVMPQVREDVPTSSASDAYLGCFNDTSDLELDGHLERSQTNTPLKCITTCRELGYAFAGLQYGESCLCGNEYGLHGESDRCDYPCTGDPAQTCGGYGTNAIYMTGRPDSADGSRP